MADVTGAAGRGSSVAAELMQRLERRDATVGVVGLGYVGLPLAVAFAKAGMRVIGVDADAGRVERIGRGRGGDFNRNDRGRGLAVAQDEDALAVMLGGIDELG